MRDTKGVHNMIYVYSPSNTGVSSVKDFEERYPGDAYVDLVGFDMYDRKPADDGVFMKQFKKTAGYRGNVCKGARQACGCGGDRSSR